MEWIARRSTGQSIWLCALSMPLLSLAAAAQIQYDGGTSTRLPQSFNTLPPNYTSPVKSEQQPVDPDSPNLPPTRNAPATRPSTKAREQKTSALYSGPTGIKAIVEKSGDGSRQFTISTDALFEPDRSILIHEAKETLTALAKLLESEKTHPITIEGHTDKLGDEKNNRELSEKRAERVKNWLLQNHAAKPEQVTISGLGSTKPAAANRNKDGADDPAARALNRRIEINVDTNRTFGSDRVPQSSTPLPAVPASDSPDGKSSPPQN